MLLLTCLLYKGFCRIVNKFFSPSFRSLPAIFATNRGMHVSIAANASTFRLSMSSSLNGGCVVKIASEKQLQIKCSVYNAKTYFLKELSAGINSAVIKQILICALHKNRLENLRLVVQHCKLQHIV